ncbi:MAG: S-layer homology domain-containing protein [Firmicutes bacterium]|nr:S-layer homology domain-containing protein [Bacillota bacterium]
MNMKFKKFALVLAIVLMASTFTPAFASPFADVPADHWAYDAIVQLAAAGLIEGYPDGTYGGSRMMTRYEAAMVFARALQRLEGQIAAMDLLPELDKVKAELMAEIEAAKAAAAAAAEKQPVETTIVERVIVQEELDEEAAALVRANQVAVEALEGDMAYLEARMLGLIDGIRYDLEQLKNQPEVEVPSMDEIEELIAKRIEEAIVEAAAAAKETTIIERVVATTPELSKEDVEFIAEALIRTQVQRLELLINENRAMIAALSDWVDEIDGDVATLKEDVAGLKTTVAELEKVQFSGSLSLTGEKEIDKPEFVFTQTGKLNLNVKASEATNVKAFVDWKLAPQTEDAFAELNKYGVEVTSTTPLKRLLVGYVDKGNLSPFGYVLASNHYKFGGVAKVEIIDDLTLELFAGADDKTAADGAVALSYKFIPELGLKLKGAAHKPYSGMFEKYAAGIGLFGTVAGIEYTGDFAMDFSQQDKNYIGVGTVKATFGDLSLDAKVAYQEKNYTVMSELLDKGNYRLGVEGGLGTKFGPLSLNARAYYEGLTHAVNDDDPSAVAEGPTGFFAFKADASAKFDLFVPVTLSGEVMGAQENKVNPETKLRALAKLAVAQENELGLRYGVSAAYEHNAWAESKPNWKNAAHYGDKDNATFTANVGYGIDLSSAKFDVDYKAAFVLPIIKDGQTDRDYTLTHNIDLAYAFTKDVKLTLGGTVKQTIPKDANTGTLTNEFGYKAGLSVSF